MSLAELTVDDCDDRCPHGKIICAICAAEEDEPDHYESDDDDDDEDWECAYPGPLSDARSASSSL